MDDFRRMMAMEGVRPLGQGGTAGRRRMEKSPTHDPAPTLPQAPAAPAYAWATGSKARTALDAALVRLDENLRAGRGGWATGIQQDGRSTILPVTSGAASLLSAADRLKLRLMILGGDGWTFVMHPMMGVATLDDDPAEDDG